MTDTTTATITDFLLARIADDEAVARAATQGRWKLWGMWVMADQDGTSNVDTAVDVAMTDMRVDGKPRTFDAAHIARHDPARVLAECEAKRAIVARAAETAASRHDDEYAAEALGLETAISILAAVYADHPDYRSDWA